MPHFVLNDTIRAKLSDSILVQKRSDCSKDRSKLIVTIRDISNGTNMMEEGTLSSNFTLQLRLSSDSEEDTVDLDFVTVSTSLKMKDPPPVTDEKHYNMQLFASECSCVSINEQPSTELTTVISK